ncbi:hypothetical protein GRI75_01190 [Altererythrobacter soli]|uniref:PAS domain-containing protein n=1 Tax=Croceibacterium soli TaxID=1739690 RepID=A0A6I4UNE0_9SPHN|nr:hypothetical protein [Croceibacterium soli]MXP40258.1 hypothetical protein [Croceibacterium soli]
MDTLRGTFDRQEAPLGDETVEDDGGRESPPAAIGQDERRMQVRAYNHWAGLLEGRNFPAIDGFDPDQLPDFGPYSVLLDFTSGIDNPGVPYLGAKLAVECDIGNVDLRTLADVPTRSLLSRITDHYMQILANQAPIGFEAEFINQRGTTILYRGILLPFSSDDETIDFIFGVINWKELADQHTSDELLLQVDQALEQKPEPAPKRGDDLPMTDWADGPGAGTTEHLTVDQADEYDFEEEEEADGLPRPSFGSLMSIGRRAKPASTPVFAEESDDDEAHGGVGYDPVGAMLDLAGFREASTEPEATGPALSELDPAAMELGDWLASARELADAALTCEDRTRSTLYEAIGRAYDFSLAAAERPEDFAELLADAGLSVQARAPMTPVVKLVFGANYDKTRITEYAAALAHARRLALPQGSLGEFLRSAPGGLKGVVKAERALRREESGKAAGQAQNAREVLAAKLREMPAIAIDEVEPYGSEFALMMIRRDQGGEIAILGEVPEDPALLERAAKKLAS